MPAQQKSIKRAYLYSVAAFLIPSWTASALIENSTAGATMDAYLISAIVLFALASFAPSVGHYYFERKKYALLSGLGRIVLIGIFIGLDAYSNSQSEEAMHPYLSFIGIALAFFWGMADFGYLYEVGKKYLAREVRAQDTEK